MIGTLLAWGLGGLGMLLILYRHDRRVAAASRRRQAEHEAEMARLQAEWEREEAEAQAELDRLRAEDGPPPDPLAEIEAELDYIRGLVADLRTERERAAAPPAPALANPPAAAMVMVPSERA